MSWGSTLLKFPAVLVVYHRKIPDRSGLVVLPDLAAGCIQENPRGLDIKRSWLHIVSIYVMVTVLSIFGGWITGFPLEPRVDGYAGAQDGDASFLRSVPCRSFSPRRSAARGARSC